MLAFYSICVSTFLYFLCCIDNIHQKDYPHALTWFSYSLANCGLIWYEYNKNYKNDETNTEIGI